MEISLKYKEQMCYMRILLSVEKTDLGIYGFLPILLTINKDMFTIHSSCIILVFPYWIHAKEKGVINLVVKIGWLFFHSEICIWNKGWRSKHTTDIRKLSRRNSRISLLQAFSESLCAACIGSLQGKTIICSASKMNLPLF